MHTVGCIVVFRSDFKDQGKQLALLDRHGAKIIRVLRKINAIAVELEADKESILSKTPEVFRIDTDEAVIEAL